MFLSQIYYLLNVFRFMLSLTDESNLITFVSWQQNIQFRYFYVLAAKMALVSDSRIIYIFNKVPNKVYGPPYGKWLPPLKETATPKLHYKLPESESL